MTGFENTNDGMRVLITLQRKGETETRSKECVFDGGEYCHGAQDNARTRTTAAAEMRLEYTTPSTGIQIFSRTHPSSCDTLVRSHLNPRK